MTIQERILKAIEQRTDLTLSLSDLRDLDDQYDMASEVEEDGLARGIAPPGAHDFFWWDRES